MKGEFVTQAKSCCRFRRHIVTAPQLTCGLRNQSVPRPRDSQVHAVSRSVPQVHAITRSVPSLMREPLLPAKRLSAHATPAPTSAALPRPHTTKGARVDCGLFLRGCGPSSVGGERRRRCTRRRLVLGRIGLAVPGQSWAGPPRARWGGRATTVRIRDAVGLLDDHAGGQTSRLPLGWRRTALSINEGVRWGVACCGAHAHRKQGSPPRRPSLRRAQRPEWESRSQLPGGRLPPGAAADRLGWFGARSARDGRDGTR